MTASPTTPETSRPNAGQVLFEREKLRVTADQAGKLTVETFLSADARVYLGVRNETYVEDGDVRIIVLQYGLERLTMYCEDGQEPVFISNGHAYSPHNLNPNATTGASKEE